MMDSAKSFLRGVMDVALVIIPLSVVLGIIFGPSVPFISPTTNQQQTQQEVCNQVTNGSPAKLQNCQFVQVLTERVDQIPQTPFTAVIGGGIVNTDISGMIAPGGEYGGTIGGDCAETCSPG